MEKPTNYVTEFKDIKVGMHAYLLHRNSDKWQINFYDDATAGLSVQTTADGLPGTGYVKLFRIDGQPCANHMKFWSFSSREAADKAVAFFWPEEDNSEPLTRLELIFGQD